MKKIFSANSKMVKSLNRSLVLNAVKNFEPISRRDIAIRLDLSPSSVSNITDRLIKEGFIREIGPGHSKDPGRKPILLEINPSTWHVIGIDLERVSSVKAGIVNLKGKLLAKSEETIKNFSPTHVVGKISRLVKILLDRAKVDKGKILGIGIGTPGLLDKKEGKVIYSVYPGWRNVEIKKLIEEVTELPVVIDTDTNAPALGEYWFGAGKKARNLIYITIGPGVGAGIIIGGKIYQGVDGTAGEFGHTVIDPEGPLCRCGNRGCLETLAAEPSLVNRVKRSIESGKKTTITESVSKEEITPEVIYKAALEGDSLAREAIAQVGRYLGMGVIGLINLLNPEFIIIGGRIIQAARLLIQSVEDVVSRYALPIPARRVRILPAYLGEDAGVIGAATLVLQNIFEIPELSVQFSDMKSFKFK